MASYDDQENFGPDFHARLHRHHLETLGQNNDQIPSHATTTIADVPPHAESPFLALLPPELRNRVFDELLAFRRHNNKSHMGIWVQRSTCHAQILATCKQVHNEASDLLMRGDKFVLFYSLGMRDTSLGSLYDLKAVFNGREVPVDDKSIPRRLRAGSTLVLGVNIEDQSSRGIGGTGGFPQLYESDPARWQKIVVSLNKALHHLYQTLGTTGIRKVELTITCAGLIPMPPDVYRALCGCLSPALAIAASVSESTSSLGNVWCRPDAADIPLLRKLFPLVRGLREETLLFNQLYTKLIGDPEAWEECPVIDGEFETREGPDGLVSHWLHHPCRLRKDIIFARGWLEESDSAGIDEAVEQCVSDFRRMQNLQAVRKEGETEEPS